MVMPEPIPCPRCGYHALNRAGMTFMCPHCGYATNTRPRNINKEEPPPMPEGIKPRTWLILGTIAFVLFMSLCIGSCAGYKSFNRYQKRADANNSVKVTHTLIRKAEQQAKIVRAQNAAIRAKADQRAIEADGIRRAQDKISKTLTPLYVQHEAIKAMAESGATTVYIPSGSQGVPLVNNISEAAK